MSIKTVGSSRKFSTFNYNTGNNTSTYVTSGLVQYFDAYINQPNSSVWVDIQGTANLALTGSPTVSNTGASNNYYITFNGTSQYGANINITSVTSFSIYTWVRSTNTNFSGAYYSQPSIMGVALSGANRDFGLTMGSGFAGVWSGLASSDQTNQPTANSSYISDNVWHEITVTSSFTNGTRLYFDRVQVGSTIPASLYTATTAWRLGMSYSQGNYYANFSTPVVMIYNTELTSTQLLQNYNYFKSRKYV